MKFNEKQQGFSLLEVMIALGVVSFLSFTVLQLVFTNLQATKSLEITASLDNLIMEVSMALKDPAICQSNLTNFSSTNLPSPLDGGTISLKQISLPSVAVPLVSSNAPLVNQPSTKMFLNIEGIKPISTTAYLANISFNLDKGQGAIGARNIVRRLPMSLTSTVAGGPITGCSAFGPSSSAAPSSPGQICALLGQTFNSTTGQCSGGPVVTLSQVCVSLGGTFDEATQRCSGVMPSGGGGSTPPTATPFIGCASATTLCGGVNLVVPALEEGGNYNKRWFGYYNNVGAQCHFDVTCKKSNWTSVECTCL